MQAGVLGSSDGRTTSENISAAPGRSVHVTAQTAATGRLVCGGHQGPLGSARLGHLERRRVGRAGNLVEAHGRVEAKVRERSFEVRPPTASV